MGNDISSGAAMSVVYVCYTDLDNNFSNTYRISSYSFCGKYSFLDMEIQRSQYIRPKVTLHKGAETI